MSWLEALKRRVTSFPRDVREAHRHSANHRTEIQASSACGCFYCCSNFQPAIIEEWVDENESGEGQTALCPVCGIDSVIGDCSGFSVAPEFLRRMNQHWF
jgi:hypothetical protein